VAVDFDEANPERSTVEAHIDASSIDTGMEARDAHLRSADFLDAAVYPELVFRSTHIEQSGDGYRIDGDLTIRGASRPVTLDAEIGGVVPNLQGGRRAGSPRRRRSAARPGDSPGTVSSRAAASSSATTSRSRSKWPPCSRSGCSEGCAQFGSLSPSPKRTAAGKTRRPFDSR